MNWYRHQQELIDMAPSRRLVAFGCGAGKTRMVLRLAGDQGGTVLVVAPKTVVLDRTWEREMLATGIEVPLTVVSKERFKKGVPAADVLVLDEGHFALGVSPMTRYRNKVEVPKASQIFEEILKWIAVNRPKAVYICSATPFPQPMALWACAELLGGQFDIDYFAFRRKFYFYVPSIGRGVWLPRRDGQSVQLLLALARKFGSFGRLEDFFDVPEQTFKDVEVGLTPAQARAIKGLPLLYPEPVVLVGKRHQAEQGLSDDGPLDENKASEILELAREFPKLLVFARFTRQIDDISSKLAQKLKKRRILVLDGRTKDRRVLLRMAEDPDEETVVVAQSQVSAGYELPSYRCTVFASVSYSFVDYQQALGRTQRANNISKNVYVHLLAGPIDRAVLACVRGKQEFNEALFAQGI